MSRTKEMYRDQVDQEYQERAEKYQNEAEDFLYQTEVLDKVMKTPEFNALPIKDRMIISEHRIRLFENKEYRDQVDTLLNDQA